MAMATMINTNPYTVGFSLIDVNIPCVVDIVDLVADRDAVFNLRLVFPPPFFTLSLNYKSNIKTIK